jgi:predicted carbohydrate-binding protein with CBM5 and CBM33 domain
VELGLDLYGSRKFPHLQCGSGPVQPAQRAEASTISHSGTLPSGLSGHHVILAVWTIADTGNAFYACSGREVLSIA